MKIINSVYIVACIIIFFSNMQSSFAISEYAISKKHLQTHVNFLCSDDLEGRLTGSIGEKRATQYVADEFQHLGLEPAGDNGTYFQSFNFTAGGKLGKNNTLTLTNQKGVSKHLILNQDWRPLAFSDSKSFTNPELIFAGYGITAPALGKLSAYDSYTNLNVQNKWVLVFKYPTHKISNDRSRQFSRYSSLRYKIFNAKKHGAKGIIFVNNELIPLKFHASLTSSGIITLSLKKQILVDLLKNNDHPLNSLEKLQASLASELNNIKLTGQIDIEKNIQHGRNVLAKLKVNSNTNQILVVGAHIDHLGRGNLGGSRGLKNESGMIHSGADDNASGVASMLETARILSALKSQDQLHGNKDILFAAWSGEEFGVLGSAHFVTHFMRATGSQSLSPHIAAAINLDMVGHLRKNLVLQSVGSSTDWPKIIAASHTHHPLAIISQNDPYLPTDSTSFYLHNVPTINFFTGAHDNYHTARDKPETLNYTGMQNISEFLVSLILKIEDHAKPIAYHALPHAHDRLKQPMKIYLGTIPDYASAEIPGVKLSGVAKNSPAEHAGLQSEDIIIELAGNKIHDIYDYTFALNALHAEQPVKLVALRGHKQVALTIVAQNRE